MPNQGEWTVGGVGTHYPGATGLTDFINAIPGPGLAGNLTAVISGNVTASKRTDDIDFNGYSLTFRNSVDHGGDPTVGPVVTVSNWSLGCSDYSGGKVIALVGLNLTGNILYMDRKSATGTFRPLNYLVQDCIFNNSNSHLVVYATSVAQYAHLLNNKFYDSTINVYGQTDATTIVENNTMYNPGVGAGAGFIFRPYVGSCSFTNTVMRNNVVVTGGSDFSDVGTVNNYPVAYNNATLDAVWAEWAAGSSGNVGGIVAADEWQSLDITEPNFLFLKDDIARRIVANATHDSGKAPLRVEFSSAVGYTYPSQVLANGGTAATLSTTDIAGLARPREDGGTAIGCHEPGIAWE